MDSAMAHYKHCGCIGNPRAGYVSERSFRPLAASVDAIGEFASGLCMGQGWSCDDPGTDAWVQLSQEELAKKRRVFKRMYVCFNAAKVID